MGNIKIFLVLKIPDSPSLTRTPSGSLSCFTIQLHTATLCGESFCRTLEMPFRKGESLVSSSVVMGDHTSQVSRSAIRG